MIKRFTAYARLLNMKQKRQDMESHVNTFIKAFDAKFDNDVDRMKALDMLNMKMERKMSAKKETLGKKYLEAEKAHDISRLITMNYKLHM